MFDEPVDAADDTRGDEQADENADGRRALLAATGAGGSVADGRRRGRLPGGHVDGVAFAAGVRPAAGRRRACENPAGGAP